jgi:hypothetical protein
MPMLLLVALLVAGCGGARSSKREFVSAANSACLARGAQARALERPQGIVGIARTADALAALERREVARLRILEPPADLRERYAAYVATLDRLAVALAELRTAIVQDGVRMADAAAREVAELRLAADRAAAGLGLACSYA